MTRTYHEDDKKRFFEADGWNPDKDSSPNVHPAHDRDFSYLIVDDKLALNLFAPYNERRDGPHWKVAYFARTGNSHDLIEMTLEHVTTFEEAKAAAEVLWRMS